jgi:hypothetical protein
MRWWVKFVAGGLGVASSAYFWLHHEWKALVAFGVGGLVGMVGSGIKWIADVRKSWNEGSLARDQRERLLQEQEDEEKLPANARNMAEIEATVRREQHLHGWIDLDDLEDIFVERLPNVDRRLIRKGIVRLKEKRKELNELWKR